MPTGIYKCLSVTVPHVVKRVNQMFTDDEFDALNDVKGDRTWHEAILEEFGVDDAGG